MSSTLNKPAEGAPFFTPAQEPAAGTVEKGSRLPSVLRPLTIRGVTFHNRVWVAPMCQYSAHDGHMTDWHLVNAGSYAVRGAGCVMLEATAVEPEGRITPEDSGLWKESQIAPLKRVADFVKSQNTLVGLQIAHAGRKASTLAPWLGDKLANEAGHGWPNTVVGPSAEAYSKDLATPVELTVERIQDLVEKFYLTAKRALAAGIQVLEVHAAHGYLIHEFLSPLSNKRTDDYGGSFENRARFAVDCTRAVKRAIDESGLTIPLFVRISALDWVDGGWSVAESIKLARVLKQDVGIDLLDVSSAGLDPRQKIKVGPGYQVDAASEIKKAVPELLVSAVGMIWRSALADHLVRYEKVDAVMAAREFLRDPSLVLTWAKELETTVKYPIQYHRAAHPPQSVVFEPHPDTAHVSDGVKDGASPKEAAQASETHHGPSGKSQL